MNNKGILEGGSGFFITLLSGGSGILTNIKIGGSVIFHHIKTTICRPPPPPWR